MVPFMLTLVRAGFLAFHGTGNGSGGCNATCNLLAAQELAGEAGAEVAAEPLDCINDGAGGPATTASTADAVAALDTDAAGTTDAKLFQSQSQLSLSWDGVDDIPASMVRPLAPSEAAQSQNVLLMLLMAGRCCQFQLPFGASLAPPLPSPAPAWGVAGALRQFCSGA